MREPDALPDLPPWVLTRREVAPALDRARAVCRRARDRRELAFECSVQANLATSRVGRTAVPAVVDVRLALILGPGCAGSRPPREPAGGVTARPSAPSTDETLRDWFRREAPTV